MTEMTEHLGPSFQEQIDLMRDRYTAALREAQKVAQAVGDTVLVGVRSNGTWFANCRGIEWDGSNPLEAVTSVADDLEKRLRDEIAASDMSARKARNALTDLVG